MSASRASVSRDLFTVAAATVVMAASMVAVVTPRAGGRSNDVQAVLERMSEAERATYQARHLVVYLGVPQSAAVVEVRSTPEGTFVRSEAGADVTRIWRKHGHRRVADEDVALEDPAAVRLPMRPADVLEKYSVEVDEPDAASDPSLVGLALIRRMDRRLVERLWVHRDNGMVYRRELYGDTGALVGMQTTLEMQWGSAGPEEPWDAGRPAMVKAESVGVAPDRLPYQYRLVSSYRMDLNDRPADHWVYSDGLHTLSVFRREGAIQRPEHFQQVERDGATLWSGPGPGTWTWEGGGHTWVVVAEEPQLDPVTLTEPLPRGGPSVWARLGSWWARAWHAVRDLFS